MSRDTTGQPVTSSGPGKSSAPDPRDMPPVPGPEGSSEGASGPALTPAALKPAAVKPAAVKPAAGTASGKVAAGEGSPAQAAQAAPSTPKPVAGDGRPGGPEAPVREAKAPRTSPEPVATPSASQKKVSSGPRRVRLALSRVDPWSVMKLSFLLSIAIGIMIVVASVVFWMVLDGLHVFTEVNDMIIGILGEETTVNILQFVELKRVVSLSTMIAIVDVVLLTALSTIAAFIYNVVAALVGGVHLTLTDE